MGMLKKSVAEGPIRIGGRSYLDNPFMGTFESDSFVLNGRMDARRKGFISMAIGKMERVNEESKTILNLKVVVPAAHYIFPLLVCSGIAASTIFNLYSGDFSMLGWAIGFISMIYVMMTVGFNLTADRYIRFIAEMLPGKEVSN